MVIERFMARFTPEDDTTQLDLSEGSWPQTRRSSHRGGCSSRRRRSLSLDVAGEVFRQLAGEVMVIDEIMCLEHLRKPLRRGEGAAPSTESGVDSDRAYANSLGDIVCAGRLRLA
jgi:hypothetical protein